MKPLPTAPAPGTPVSSSLIRELIDAIRARTILRGKGYRTNETPNGTVLEIERQSPSVARRLPGLFEPEYGKGDYDEVSVTFKYPYYMVGTRLYRVEDENAVIYPGNMGCISYLSISLTGEKPTAVCGSVSTFTDLQVLAGSPDISIVPLYNHDSRGMVVRDFRNMPTITTREFST